MKKYYLLITMLLLISGYLYYFNIGSLSDLKTYFSFKYSVTLNSESYKEYLFAAEDEETVNSRYALSRINKSTKMLHEGSVEIEYETIKYIEIDYKNEADSNTYQRKKLGDDLYELRRKEEKETVIWQLYKNNQFLFEKPMYHGVDGPILDWRNVDGKLALTYLYTCGVEKVCTDIFYDNSFIKDRYKVENPRYLFLYRDKIGFIAKDHSEDKVYFDEKFVSGGFDAIHTHNCCAVFELLPTVYSNGTLVFYANRGENDYIGEVKLIN